MKSSCACEWGGWGRLSEDGPAHYNPDRSGSQPSVISLTGVPMSPVIFARGTWIIANYRDDGLLNRS